MNWVKEGLVFSASGQQPWMRSHASLPVALQLDGDLYRIYFASRDEQNRSHVSFVDVNINAPKEILRVSEKPVLAPGPLGHFDDHGVYCASIVRHDARLFMYYIGWNPGAKSPLFYSSIGLAVSEDGGESYRKMFKAPILARSEHDPCLVTSPCVLLDDGRWRMWYVSGFKWEAESDGLHSYYHIKYAESADGINWERNGLVSIDHRPGERNIARPCVVRDQGLYRMWYSYSEGEGYRIGYAESSQGYDWTRKDSEVGISLSETGWDSRALAYPWVFSHAGKRYMLYNGNQFGQEGFGLATLA
jgi:hypothetical protein